MSEHSQGTVAIYKITQSNNSSKDSRNKVFFFMSCLLDRYTDATNTFQPELKIPGMGLIIGCILKLDHG